MNEFLDKAMAANFDSILKQAGGCKTLLLAHNGYIGKIRNQPGLKVSLGGELKRKYGVSYYALGTTFIKEMYLRLTEKPGGIQSFSY